jgi:hypothetical protein
MQASMQITLVPYRDSEGLPVLGAKRWIFVLNHMEEAGSGYRTPFHTIR